MNEAQFIGRNFASGFKGKFLAMGEWSEVTRSLLEAGWTGVVADHLAAELSKDAAMDGVIYVHGPIGMENHYVEVELNYKMRCVTLRDILDTFPGPFNLLLVSVPGLGKDLSTCDAVWNMWPEVICVHSEGREQEIVNLANQHSYNPSRIERDSLILARVAKAGPK